MAYPEYVGLELQFGGRRRVHESQQRSHVVVAAGRQHQLLDDEQRVLATLPVLHDVVHAPRAPKLPEQGCKRGKKGPRYRQCTKLIDRLCHIFAARESQGQN